VQIHAPVALVADSASFVYRRWRSPGSPSSPRPSAEHGHLVAGLRYVFGSPTMRSAPGATATINSSILFFALFVLYATR
jgi:hypothetical protein